MTNRITFSIRGPAQVGFSLDEPPAVGIDLGGFAVVREALPAYDGPMEVTPGGVPQVLLTTGKSLYSDIVVNPVPPNYGLITWDGTIITVS